MLTEIKNILIKKIHRHPDNPRKDLGDLSELVESIKARGVLQNLTVVKRDPGHCGSNCKLFNNQLGKCKESHDEKHIKSGTNPPLDCWQDNGEYYAVIGNRRLAASIEAKLKELPCAVSDMVRKEQIATMLLENMQRCDLTMVEQAEGMQMMIDLGETVKAVSDRTGLSETTIRRRVKMLETFGRDALESVQGRPIKIEDYEGLYKITNEKARKEVFSKIGTPEFNYKLESALNTQKREERKKKIIDLLKSVANKGTHDEARNGTEVWHSFQGSEYDYEELEKKVKSLKDQVEYYWYDGSKQYHGFGLYTKEKPKKQKTTDSKEEKERKARTAALNEAFTIAYGLRLAFVKNFTVTTKTLLAVESMAASILFLGEYIKKDTFRDYAGIETKFRESWQNADKGESYEEAAARFLAEEFTGKQSSKALLVGAYIRLDDSSMKSTNSYHGYYDPSEKLNTLYRHLQELGYEMSEDETKLLDGTHELIYKPEWREKQNPVDDQEEEQNPDNSDNPDNDSTEQEVQ